MVRTDDHDTKSPCSNTVPVRHLCHFPSFRPCVGVTASMGGSGRPGQDFMREHASDMRAGAVKLGAPRWCHRAGFVHVPSASRNIFSTWVIGSTWLFWMIWMYNRGKLHLFSIYWCIVYICIFHLDHRIGWWEQLKPETPINLMVNTMGFRSRSSLKPIHWLDGGFLKWGYP